MVLFCILWLIVLDAFVVCVRFCCLLVVMFIVLMRAWCFIGFGCADCL